MMAGCSDDWLEACSRESLLNELRDCVEKSLSSAVKSLSLLECDEGESCLEDSSPGVSPFNGLKYWPAFEHLVRLFILFS